MTLARLSSSEFRELFLSVKSDIEAGRAKLDELEELLIHRCATDMELFSVAFFPHYCTREFNEFHRDMFTAFKWRERAIRRARAAPRGSAKSTLATLIKPIHDVCYGLEKFVLIISSTTPLANKKLKDIRNEVQTNSALFAVYGTCFPRKKAGESEFRVFSDLGACYFVALGKGAEVRGIRINEARPTKIVLDDVEYSEEVYNEIVRGKTKSWLFEDVTKAGDTGTNIEFVGTILHPESLLADLCRNPAYDSAIYKAIISWSQREDLWEKWREIYCNLDNPNRLADSQAFYDANESELLLGTQVLWPEKETYLDHMKDMVEIGRRAFMKEKQNEPESAEDNLFERIHWYREEADGCRILSTNALVPWDLLKRDCIGAWDPATGKKKPKQGARGDFTSIGVGYVQSLNSGERRLFVHHDFTKRVSPTRGITEVFNLHDKFKFARMAVETNLYRELLLPNLEQEKRTRERATNKPVRVGFYEVEQTENKNERITRLEPKVNHGWILFNVGLSQDFKNQLMNFPHASHDDAPDMVEIMWNLAHGRYRAAAVALSVDR